MKIHKQRPHTNFFLNAGVPLTTTHAETVAILKDVEGRGVEIDICETCFKQYDLTSTIKVGCQGATDLI